MPSRAVTTGMASAPAKGPRLKIPAESDAAGVLPGAASVQLVTSRT